MLTYVITIRFCLLCSSLNCVYFLLELTYLCRLFICLFTKGAFFLVKLVNRLRLMQQKCLSLGVELRSLFVVRLLCLCIILRLFQRERVNFGYLLRLLKPETLDLSHLVLDFVYEVHDLRCVLTLL